MSKPLEITLRIDGEDVAFTQEFIPFKFKRKALEIEKYARSDEADPEEVENRQLNLIVEIFDKKFTRKQINDGLNTIDHRNVIYDIIGVGVLGYPTREEIEKEKEDFDLGKLLENVQKESQ
ncbi:hypothetical protein P9235_22675 [Bacillus licheniformis]|uniref:phage tail assembly chaperone G n=1 Tax=Bacillus licheniformis TaxID=1402 RepID=UPI002E216C23|nr:hypothetical protein [Bacillus licheniformis]